MTERDITITAAWPIAAVVAFVLIALLIWWLLKLRKPKPVQYGANPNPTNVTDEMWWLWQQLYALEPSSQLGGIYANKPGYHNARYNLPSYDYSVCDQPPDGGGPSSAACALDWTFPEAQSGDYTRIAKYTSRLLASAHDPDDPRLNGWREFYGQADKDSYVEGWDIRYNRSATSDSSHLWHIHLSESRDQSTSRANKEAILSVLKGQTVDEWRGVMPQKGDGAVLLFCPTDKTRIDLLYVGPAGNVWHRWCHGDMNALWSGKGVAGENLGGIIVPGTLTAAWSPDGSVINIAGLGQCDTTSCPDGCGQYWGFTASMEGAKSGWGSFPSTYGQYPVTQLTAS